MKISAINADVTLKPFSILTHTNKFNGSQKCSKFLHNVTRGEGGNEYESGRQLHVQDFLSTKPRSAANPYDKDHWKLANIVSGVETVEFAIHVLRENGGKQFEGMVFQLNQMSQPTRSTTFKPWPQ